MSVLDDTLQVGRITRQIVVVPGVIKLEAYSKLVQFLKESLGYQSGVDMLEFPYDWRRDNRHSARRLEQAIAVWKQHVLGKQAKVTIIAHSMGCLLSRYYVECLGGAEHVDRMILMGGPHAGSLSAAEAILRGLRLFPFGLFSRGIHQILLNYPSSYQLVATQPVIADAAGRYIRLHDDDRWIPEQYRHLLHDAVRFHDELGVRSSVPTLCVFGYGIDTPTRLRVESSDSKWWEGVQFLYEKTGDNKVLQTSAFLEGTEIHPVHQYHGALWTDNDVKMRLKLELNR